MLNKKLQEAGLHNKAKVITKDFLLIDETQKFDLIFTNDVMQHFENADPFFSKISKLLKDDSILVLTEPSQVNSFYAFLRKFYNPFQSDAAWEWPFTHNIIATMENYLQTVDGFGWGRRSLLRSMFQGFPIIGNLTNSFYNDILRKKYRLSSKGLVKFNDNRYINSPCNIQ
jgi:SAM-dependent methyltransferase